MIANAPTIGKKYGMFSGWGWQLEKWRYCWWFVGGGAEARLVNKDVNIQEGDMGRGDFLRDDLTK